MPRTSGSYALALLGLAACAAPPPASPRSTVAEGTQRPKVVVTIVVDQLAGWIAEERWPELPPTGGFARLVREGTWVEHMVFAHAVTDTAPGHSALYTASAPHESGIFANEVPNGTGQASILRDPDTRLVTEDGARDAPGASLRVLRAETLADRFRRERPAARVLSFSFKDRGALFAGGRSPEASLWFDPELDRFVTSTAFADRLPGWALPVVSAGALARAQASTWKLLDPPWVVAHARTTDDQDGEGEEPGYGAVFPHALGAARRPGYALRTSPMGDELLFALALAGLDADERGGRETLLALSLSANDYIGHVFGPDSWEAWDELARLDRALAGFLVALDARFGRDGYAVLLTADHGVTTMPEAALVRGVRSSCGAGKVDPWDRACGAVGRILPDAARTELEAAARRALGPGEWVASVVDPYVYLTPAARQLEPHRRALLDDAVSATLRGHPEVDHVTPTRALPALCPPASDESVAALVCRSVAPGAGDFYVTPSRGSFFDPRVIVGKGTSHGTPYRYDRVVPLLARAPGWIAAGRIVKEDVGFETFARTAGDLLGIGATGPSAGVRSLVSPGRDGR